jgi:uncharacterized SAM-binding protein YcdF (DUF218 family)
MNQTFHLKLILDYIFRPFKIFLLILGSILFLALVLSFTDYPYWAYYWLGVHNANTKGNPNVIVLLGGGGMPSPDGLMRAYYTARNAIEFPSASIYIAMPHDTALRNESPEYLLAHELTLRGIDSNRIHYETEGISTRSQAMNLRKIFGNYFSDTLILRIITSPEHMFRSVATFRKAGFKNVGGMASFEEAISENSLLGNQNKRLKSERLNFRYNMWNYLKYEISVVREYFAIAYYKIRGWM